MDHTHVAEKLHGLQVPDAHVRQLLSLPEAVKGAINWPALITLITTDGPKIVAALLVIFGVTPATVPPPK
jgi:hypothetical protein